MLKQPTLEELWDRQAQQDTPPVSPSSSPSSLFHVTPQPCDDDQKNQVEQPHTDTTPLSDREFEELYGTKENGAPPGSFYLD